MFVCIIKSLRYCQYHPYVWHAVIWILFLRPFYSIGCKACDKITSSDWKVAVLCLDFNMLVYFNVISLRKCYKSSIGSSFRVLVLEFIACVSSIVWSSIYFVAATFYECIFIFLLLGNFILDLDRFSRPLLNRDSKDFYTK